MPHRTFVICFLISFFCALLNGRSHHNNFHEHESDSYELVNRRSTSKFTTAQRQVQKQMLKEHNAYRAMHCALPLKLDDELNRSAQKYAEQLAKTKKFEHSDLQELGENLFYMESNYPIEDLVEPTTQATKGWYDEIKGYDFKEAKFSQATGHLTQLLWKESTKMGVGYAEGKSGSDHTLFIVAHYSPGGNVDDEFHENVLPSSC